MELFSSRPMPPPTTVDLLTTVLFSSPVVLDFFSSDSVIRTAEACAVRVEDDSVERWIRSLAASTDSGAEAKVTFLINRDESGVTVAPTKSRPLAQLRITPLTIRLPVEPSVLTATPVPLPVNR